MTIFYVAVFLSHYLFIMRNIKRNIFHNTVCFLILGFARVEIHKINLPLVLDILLRCFGVKEGITNTHLKYYLGLGCYKKIITMLRIVRKASGYQTVFII